MPLFVNKWTGDQHGSTCICLTKDERSSRKHVAPKVSVVIPLYNTERYIQECISSVLCQRYSDFEVLVIDDGSTDQSADLVNQIDDPRIRYVYQDNRGLPGARNTGIRLAKGRYIAFLDADDYWHPNKLAMHVRHLDENPRVGVSFSGSIFVDDNSLSMGVYQDPKLTHITPRDIYLANPIGNGSSPVIRKAVFDSIQFSSESNSARELSFFNERFRQSEDVECWMRIGLKTEWRFEGIVSRLTYYRVNNEGLSANWQAQLNSWLKMAAVINAYAPSFVKRNFSMAKAHQYRYLARRAVISGKGATAFKLMCNAIYSNPFVIVLSPKKTLVTLVCVSILLLFGERVFEQLVRLSRKKARAVPIIKYQF
ncbi:MAG: glucosyl transferase [Gammaproteobacteria bacterium]|nr:MAG: glucosyl transferase [Gammaproteobacteria bacterium]